MNVIVTGGAGYIGSHACKALSNAGYMPIALDSLIQGHRNAVQWGPLEVGDIADREFLNLVIEKYQPTAVMHFAAHAYVGESVENPGKYYRNNVAGTLTLLEALRDYEVNKFIFSSTCATYGVPQDMPISEDHPQHPVNPYGASKLMIERILQDFEKAHKLRHMSLRYFNAAGADPDGAIGESHNPETHLIPLIFEVALGMRSAITIFGNDHKTTDGTCVRDYIHVDDLAEAHVLALTALNQGRPSRAYNLGNGMGFSVREVIEVAETVTGCVIPVEIGSKRPGDPPILVGNATRAIQELGWQPKHQNLMEILRTAWNWHLKNYDLRLK
jgi:UDP-arabinose 4-epimerase